MPSVKNLTQGVYNLSAGQKAALLIDDVPIFEKTLEKEDSSRRANSKIADMFNTNRTYVHQAKVLKAESPERFEKVKTGEIKLNKAFTEMKQEKLQEKKEEIRRIEAESIKTDYTPKYYIEDYKEFLDSFDDNSVDTLITDPPFSTDIDDIKLFAESWLPLALNKVKKSGRGYVFIGAYPVEIKAYLDIFLSQSKFIIDSPLIWTYKNTLGNTPKMKYNLNYQMILHFYADESHELDKSITNEMFSVMEFNAPDGRQFDRLHKWQKPDRLALNLLRHSTAKNDIVVDCFSGSGTFLAAAAKLEMFSYGCDIDIDASKIAERRGACIINGQQI
jgi:DNA modification methylase